MPRTSPFTCGQVLLDQEAPVDDHAARIGDAGRGKAGIVLADAAVDRIDVDGRLARPVRHHRHGGAPAGERRIELRLEGVEHRAHVADGAVAEERHRAVGDAPLGLDLRPPHAAMAEADPVLVERLGNDDVVDARPRHDALVGEIGDAAIAARFLVRRAGNLDGAGMVGKEGEEGLHRHDRGRQPALHVAGAAAVDAPLAHGPAERIEAPAGAGLDHVDMAVEMDARPRPPAFAPGDHVPARIAVAVAGGALRAHEGRREAERREPPGDDLAAVAIGLAGRVDRGDADQLGGQRHQIVAAILDLTPDCLQHLVALHPARERARPRTEPPRCQDRCQFGPQDGRLRVRATASASRHIWPPAPARASSA